MRLRRSLLGIAVVKGSWWRFAVFGLVLLLGLGIVTAQAIAGNVAAGEILKQSIQALPYDYSTELLTASPSEIEASLSSVEGVTSATYAFWVYVGAQARASGREASLQIAGVAGTFANLAPDFGWGGNFTLLLGAVVLSIRTAAQLGVQVGSPVELGYELCSPTNGSCSFQGQTYVVSGIVRQVKSASNQFLYGSIAFLTESDGMSLFQLIMGRASAPPSTTDQPDCEFFVWIDRGSLLNPLDPGGNIRRASQMQLRLEMVPSVGMVLSPLVEALQAYQGRLVSLQGLFLAVSVPSLLLAVALGLTALERASQLAVERVRVMRVRGLSLRTALLALAVPSLLIAAATLAAASLVLPRAFEALLLSIGPFQDLAVSYPSWSFAGIPLLSLLAGLALLVSIFALYARHVAASFREFRPTRNVMGVQTPVGIVHKDLILVGAAVALWCYSAFYTEIQQLAPGVSLLLDGLVAALLPIAGVFFVAGLIRPLLRVRRLRAALGRSCAVISGPVGRRYLPDRLSRSVPPPGLPLLIAIAVALLLLTFTSLASERAFEQKRIAALIGGDMLVDEVGNLDLSQALGRLAGVRAVTEADLLPPIEPSIGYLVLFNSSSYQTVVSSDPYFFGGLGAGLSVLLRGSTVIANAAAAEQLGVRTGDGMPVRYGVLRSEVVSVVGIVNAMPGLQPPWAEDLRTPLLYGDLASFRQLFPEYASDAVSQWRFLLGLEPGVSTEALALTILNNAPQVTQILDGGGDQRSTSVGTLAEPFLVTDSFLSYALIVSASGAMMAAFLAAKRAEVTTIRVRGASRGVVSRLLYGEALTQVLFGFLVGLVGGLASSWFFVDGLSKMLDPMPLGRPFVVGPESLLAIGTFAITLFGILAASAWISSQPRLAHALRERS